ncbi:hypothetical protein V6Z12_D06G072100 [Gossypium hirsutum]
MPSTAYSFSFCLLVADFDFAFSASSSSEAICSSLPPLPDVSSCFSSPSIDCKGWALSCGAQISNRFI